MNSASNSNSKSNRNRLHCYVIDPGLVIGNIMVCTIFRTNQDMSKYRVLLNSLTVSHLSPIDSLLVGVGIGLEEEYMLYCLAVLSTKFGLSSHLFIILGSSITNSMTLTYS